MLILDAIRRRLHIRVNCLRIARHLGHLFQDNRIVHRLCRILSPGKGAMVLAEYCRRVNRVDASCLEGLNDDHPGVLLVSLVNLFLSQISGTWNRSEEIVRMCGSVQRNISARLCPSHSFRRMGMNDSADIRIFLVQLQMGSCVRGRLVTPLDLIALQIHDHHILRGQFVIIHTTGFNDKISGLTVNSADVAPGIGNESSLWKLHIRFIDFLL